MINLSKFRPYQRASIKAMEGVFQSAKVAPLTGLGKIQLPSHNQETGDQKLREIPHYNPSTFNGSGPDYTS